MTGENRESNLKVANKSAGKIIKTAAIGLLSAGALVFLQITDHSEPASVYASEPDAAAQQAPEAEIMTVREKRERIWNEYPGSLEPVDSVEIKPRVSGAITKVLYKQGGNVRAGQLLFVIDPRPYEAALAKAKADAEAAKAAVTLTRSERERARKLSLTKAISQSRYEIAKSAYDTAIAQLKSAEAATRQAQLNLEYAYVKAPVPGKVGRAEITVGNIVEAGMNAPVLTEIVSDKEIYAEFNMDEKIYLRNMRGAVKEIPAEAVVAGDTNISYTGKIVSFDNRLDVKTGSVRARALLANKDGALTPGMFVTVRVGSPELKTLVTVPTKAILTDQDKKYVYTVNSENMIEYRVVTPGEGGAAGERVIENGLKAGEKIIVNGFMKVRPGMKITPKEVSEKIITE